MATIRPNEHAPAEDVTYILPTATFDLGADGSYDTDDRAVIQAASDHPWLAVEFPEVDEEIFQVPSKRVPYEDDPLSAYNDHSNDPERVAEDEHNKYNSTVSPLAVEAGLDQGEAVSDETGRVDYTLAAVDEHPDADASEEENS